METIPLLMFGLAAFAGCSVILIVLDGGGKRRLARRAKDLGATGRQSRRTNAGPQLRLKTQGGLDGLLHRILPRPAALRTRLAASGTGMSIGRYGVICLVVGIVVAILFMLRGIPPLGALLFGTLAGLWLPHAAIGWLIKRRRGKFLKLFPEAIGLIVRGLRAGLPVTETILVLGREVADPVGEEFRRAGDQIRLGQPIEEAMWAIARRLEMAEFNFLVVTLSVQRETGGNLAETLENLEEILRKRQQMRLKIKAMSSEATATASIIGSLPFIMTALLFVVSPGYIMTLFTPGLGYLMIAGGVTSMVVGMMVMAKMISFDI